MRGSNLSSGAWLASGIDCRRQAAADQLNITTDMPLSTLYVIKKALAFASDYIEYIEYNCSAPEVKVFTIYV